MDDATATIPAGAEGANQAQDPLLKARSGLAEARRLRAAGRFEQAGQQCQLLLRRFPDFAAAHHLLGVVLAEQQRFPEALPHFIQAAMLNPKWHTALTDLAGIYLQLGADLIAARTIEQALRLKVDDPGLFSMLGEIRWQDQEFEAGAEAFRRAQSLDHSLDSALVGLGACLTHVGDLAGAATAYEKVLDRHPGSLDIIYLLSQLPPSYVHADLAGSVETAKPPAAAPEISEARLAITRAAVFRNAGRHAEAWNALVDGNRRLAPRLGESYHADRRSRHAVLKQAETTARPSLAAVPADDAPPVSLFILGPSQSGKSTMERLVTALGGIKRGYESKIVLNAVRAAYQTADLPPLHRVADLPAALEDLFCRFYLDELEERAGSAGVFTNTNPGHVSGALRLAEIVPNARFVLIRRDRRDVTLRMFMKMYDEGNAYSYDLGSIAEYLDWYERMIDLIADRLPTISTVIDYDRMVADPKEALSRVADLCGQPMPAGPVPTLGDDRGCSAPYRALLDAASAG